MARINKVNKTTAETKAEIVANSVQDIATRPALSAAELKKQFVKPVVNEDGVPCAISELNRVAEEAEAALDEVYGYYEDKTEETRQYAESAAKDRERAEDAAIEAAGSESEAQNCLKLAKEAAVASKESADVAQEAAEQAKTTLSGKVDKAGTGASTRVYGVEANGNQTIIPVYKDSARENSIPGRRASGSIIVGTPEDQWEATPKDYVDNGLLKKLDIKDRTGGEYAYGIGRSGDQTLYIISPADGEKYAIVRRNANGKIVVTDPVRDSEPVNLKYANDHFAKLENGKVPAEQLPSYVDDVIIRDTKSAFPAAGEPDKIYVAADTGSSYRWGNTSVGYIEISSPPKNYVTTDTEQEITALKRHSSSIVLDKSPKQVTLTGDGINIFDIGVYADYFAEGINFYPVSDGITEPYTLTFPHKSGTLVLDSDLDGKLDKKDISDGSVHFYGVYDNEQVLRTGSLYALPATVVYRDWNGDFYVNDPKEARNPASKNYVDKNFVTLKGYQEITDVKQFPLIKLHGDQRYQIIFESTGKSGDILAKSALDYAGFTRFSSPNDTVGFECFFPEKNGTLATTEDIPKLYYITVTIEENIYYVTFSFPSTSIPETFADILSKFGYNLQCAGFFSNSDMFYPIMQITQEGDGTPVVFYIDGRYENQHNFSASATVTINSKII